MDYIKIKRDGYVRYLFQFKEGELSIGANKIGYLTIKWKGEPTVLEMINAFREVTEIFRKRGIFPETRVPKGDRTFQMIARQSGYRRVGLTPNVPFELWTSKPIK